MTSDRLGEMFKGDSADTCAGKFPLVTMGGRANGQARQMVSDNPHRRERNFSYYSQRLRVKYFSKCMCEAAVKGFNFSLGFVTGILIEQYYLFL